MLLWFVGTAIVSVWYVFRDPRFDYRLLCVGALAPDLIDAILGGARVMHSVVVAIALLMAVVIASSGRKPWRKRALAVPIGMMLHLVFDGAFTNTRVFWWPLGGVSFGDERLPSIERGWLTLLLELLGAGLLWWIWRTFGLASPRRRQAFWKEGRLEPVGSVRARR